MQTNLSSGCKKGFNCTNFLYARSLFGTGRIRLGVSAQSSVWAFLLTHQGVMWWFCFVTDKAHFWAQTPKSKFWMFLTLELHANRSGTGRCRYRLSFQIVEATYPMFTLGGLVYWLLVTMDPAWTKTAQEPLKTELDKEDLRRGHSCLLLPTASCS